MRITGGGSGRCRGNPNAPDVMPASTDPAAKAEAAGLTLNSGSGRCGDPARQGCADHSTGRTLLRVLQSAKDAQRKTKENASEATAANTTSCRSTFCCRIRQADPSHFYVSLHSVNFALAFLYDVYHYPEPFSNLLLADIVEYLVSDTARNMHQVTSNRALGHRRAGSAVSSVLPDLRFYGFHQLQFTRRESPCTSSAHQPCHQGEGGPQWLFCYFPMIIVIRSF